jgi:membrane protein DedA with SNARE-associated domain
MNEITQLLNQYGYIVLFISLMLELIIVPIPNEAMMSYVGVLCFHGKMNIFLSILSAGAGGIFGVSISYWIGYKLGAPFFRKYGHFIHMGPEKMERMEKWFQKYGKALLLFAFFIPGVRHIASIVSGVIKLPFRTFSSFSYIGVFLWVGTFISLGDILGPQWDQFQGEIKKWLILASIIFGIIAIIYFVIKTNRDYIKESFLLLNQSAFKRFRSFLKIKLIILVTFIFFVTFFTLMVGLIQDLISNEFGKFNLIAKTIIFSLFNVHWQWIMDSVSYLSNWISLVIVSLLTLIIIFVNKKNKWLEVLFFVSTLVGTYLFSQGIGWLFHYIFDNKLISNNFPNEKAMLIMSVYGFFLIMFIRHKKDFLLATVMFFLVLFILTGNFISEIYIFHFKPSDLLTSYVFSGVWVTGMAFSLEMFRLLSLIKIKIKEEISSDLIHRKK